MNSATDPVLELLADAELALPPGAIAYNLQHEMGNAPSQSTITRAISDLEDYGLIEVPEDANTYYRITDKGRAYLDGELDASEFD